MVTTAERLNQLAQRSPQLNLTEAAQVVGVTRERVRQLANEYALPFRRGAYRRPRPACDLCGQEVILPHNRRHAACIQELARSPEQRAHVKRVAKECHQRWGKNNRERWNAYSREYHRTHAEQYAAYTAQWRAKNPDKVHRYGITSAVNRLRRLGYTVVPPSHGELPTPEREEAS